MNILSNHYRPHCHSTANNSSQAARKPSTPTQVTKTCARLLRLSPIADTPTTPTENRSFRQALFPLPTQLTPYRQQVRAMRAQFRLPCDRTPTMDPDLLRLTAELFLRHVMLLAVWDPAELSQGMLWRRAVMREIQGSLHLEGWKFRRGQEINSGHVSSIPSFAHGFEYTPA